MKQYPFVTERTRYRKCMIGVAGGCAALILPHVVGSYITMMLNYVLIYSLQVSGLGLLIGWAGQFSLAQATFFGIGGYAAALVSLSWGFNPWLGLLISGIFTGVIGYLLGKPFLSVPGFKVGFITLGFSWAVWLIADTATFTGGHFGLSGIPHFSIGSLVLTKDYQYYYLLLIAMGVALLLNRKFVNSRLGKEARAMDVFTGGSTLAAKSLGINIGDFKARIFALTAGYSGISGGIFVYYMGTMCPDTIGVWPNLILLIIIIVGGVHSLWGGLAGALAYFGIKELLTIILAGSTPPGWEYLSFGVIVTLILLFFPEGVSGGFFKVYQWWSERVSSRE